MPVKAAQHLVVQWIPASTGTALGSCAAFGGALGTAQYLVLHRILPSARTHMHQTRHHKVHL